MAQETIYYATGKRKNAIARTWMMPGKGDITVNDRPLDDYFKVPTAITILKQPLVLTNNEESFDIKVKVKGGGVSGQAGAVRHGITKALIEFDLSLRAPLKKAGFVTRDPRKKERKKYGQKGARARFQFSKR
ncbi:MAG: 30S ribosomal protein S9 [Desulfobacteraceae bacterium]|nr:30S ribosomal protein S9 [Desulfobacteraceae bacterium]